MLYFNQNYDVFCIAVIYNALWPFSLSLPIMLGISVLPQIVDELSRYKELSNLHPLG